MSRGAVLGIGAAGLLAAVSVASGRRQGSAAGERRWITFKIHIPIGGGKTYTGTAMSLRRAHRPGHLPSREDVLKGWFTKMRRTFGFQHRWEALTPDERDRIMQSWGAVLASNMMWPQPVSSWTIELTPVEKVRGLGGRSHLTLHGERLSPGALDHYRGTP
jgi:hypothetical protein